MRWGLLLLTALRRPHCLCCARAEFCKTLA
jgi:hypothetical protein